jgi:glycosyltransferase involved in cell wall biosynthesis
LEGLPDSLSGPAGPIDNFPGRLAVQQRVLPSYRLPFFEALAGVCTGGLSLFAGQPGVDESIETGRAPRVAHYMPARNLSLGDVSQTYYLLWQAGLLRWLEDRDPDALVVEANPRYLSTSRAVSWMHRRGRPVIGWGLGAPPLHGPLAALRQPGRLRFLRRFDAWIAYSRRGAAEYAALGLPQERIFVAPNAAVDRPRALPVRPEGFTGRPAVLFVGRLQPRKRLDNLLRACAALPEVDQPRLLVVGGGPAREELQSLAARIYPPAEFLGALHGAALEPVYAQADLFVLPGTGGLAVQQAMAHGLPVVVAEGDGTQEDLVRPGNGWRVPAGDLAALIGALSEALSDAARLRRMGAESFRIVAEEVNLQTMAAVFVRAVRVAMGSVRRP